MFKKPITIFSTALLLFFSCSNLIEKPLAVVNGRSIMLYSFKTGYKEFLDSRYQPDNLLNRFLFLNNMIDELLIIKYAGDIGVEDEPGFIEEKEKIFNQLLLNTYFDEKINIQHTVTDSEKRKLFEWKNTSIHIRHLFAHSYQEIHNIKTRLEQGKAWESLAEECFQDPVLHSNGGDLGWVQLGDMEPVFEFTAFSLDNGAISSPIKTKHGYSIIQLIERERNGFLKEEDYQIVNKEIAIMADHYKRQFFLLDYTSKIEKSLMIEYDQEILEKLFYSFSISTDQIELIKNENLVTFRGNKWEVSQVMKRINTLSNRQMEKINTVMDIKHAITGLICRSYFLDDAKSIQLHKKKSFQKDFEQHKNKAVVQYVLAMINGNLQPLDKKYEEKARKMYFDFRNEIVKQNNISIDSLALKTFIM